MMKTLLASLFALAMFALAACEGGESPPPNAGANDMNQTEPAGTMPADPAPEPAQ